jgi:hypothetical protein
VLRLIPQLVDTIAPASQTKHASCLDIGTPQCLVSNCWKQLLYGVPKSTNHQKNQKLLSIILSLYSVWRSYVGTRGCSRTQRKNGNQSLALIPHPTDEPSTTATVPCIQLTSRRKGNHHLPIRTYMRRQPTANPLALPLLGYGILGYLSR